MARRNLNYHPNYPTHPLYFGEVETPYRTNLQKDITCRYRNPTRNLYRSYIYAWLDYNSMHVAELTHFVGNCLRNLWKNELHLFKIEMFHNNFKFSFQVSKNVIDIVFLYLSSWWLYQSYVEKQVENSTKLFASCMQCSSGTITTAMRTDPIYRARLSSRVKRRVSPTCIQNMLPFLHQWQKSQKCKHWNSSKHNMQQVLIWASTAFQVC